MHAQHQYGRIRPRLQNFPRRFQPIHPRHRAIHHNHRRLFSCRQPHSSLAIACFADHLDLWIIFQDSPESVPHQRMIVYQQYFELSCHGSRLSPVRYADEPSCHPSPAAKALGSLRLFPPVPASPPNRFRVHFSPPQFLCRGLPLPIPAHQTKTSAAPTLPSLPNAGSHYSTPPATRGTHARLLLHQAEKPFPIFHSASQAPSAAPPSEYTSPACSRALLHPAAPDAAPAKGCEYCPESFARSRALPVPLRALSSLPGDGFPRAPAASQSPSAPARTHHATRAKCAAAWILASKSVFAPIRCAARKAPPVSRKQSGSNGSNTNSSAQSQ